MNDQPTPVLNRTSVDLSLLIVRVAAGVVFVAHGGQKLFGLWGGPGLEGITLPAPDGLGMLGYPVAVGEFFGGLGLIFGFLSRFSAAALIVIMIGAIALVHGQHGFLMGNDLTKAGFEYNWALIGLMLPTLLAGPGSYAIGRFIMPKSQPTGRPLIYLE